MKMLRGGGGTEIFSGIKWGGGALKVLNILRGEPTSFPGLQCEDETRHEEALVWAGQFCILIG